MFGLDIEMGSYTNGLTSESEFGYDDYYLGDDVSSVIRPKKELKRFCKVALAPGETRTVSFELTGEDLKFYDDKAGAWVLEPGRFTVYVAASADDVKGSACFDVICE